MDITVVERSWGLLSQIPTRKNQFYGPKFNWAEYSKPTTWVHGIFDHWGLSLGLLMLAFFPLVRILMRRLAYQPGEGTSKKDMVNEEIEYRGVATPDTAVPSGKQAYCQVSFDGGMYACQ